MPVIYTHWQFKLTNENSAINTLQLSIEKKVNYITQMTGALLN